MVNGKLIESFIFSKLVHTFIMSNSNLFNIVKRQFIELCTYIYEDYQKQNMYNRSISFNALFWKPPHIHINDTMA